MQINRKSQEPIKQLLNFTHKECEQYDISEYNASILALNGNNTTNLIILKLFIQTDNKKEIFKFFSQKGKEFAIKKRILSIINSLITNKRNTKFYEIEYKTQISGFPIFIGAMKFHSQNNTRIICNELNKNNEIIIIMIEACKKTAQKNIEDSKYNQRLKSSANIKHYIIDKSTNKKIYLS